MKICAHVTKRTMWMFATLGMLVYLIDLALNQNLSTTAAMAVIILAADQIFTHITYRGIKERLSMMFPMILVTIIYLPPHQAVVASLLGVGGAYCLQWAFDKQPLYKVAVNTLSAATASLSAILVFNTIEHVLNATWPSLASAVAASAAGISFELVSYSVLALAWMFMGRKTFLDTVKIWLETWWYSLFGVTSALAIALTTERSAWVSLAFVGVLLTLLRPSYEFRQRAAQTGTAPTPLWMPKPALRTLRAIDRRGES